MTTWRCRAVLFDLFDTLCHIEPSLYRDGKDAGAALLGLSPDDWHAAWVAAGDEAQVGRLADVAARVRNVVERLGAPPPAEGLVARVVEIERDTLLRATRLHPDVLPTLEALRRRADLPLALVSNASCGVLDLFEALGLAPYFDATLWSFRVGVVKPDPAIYRAACEALGVRPDECVFVGDGNASELDGARAVGMRAVRIERPVSLSAYRKAESRSFDASIGDLRRLAEFLPPPSVR